MIVMAAAAVGMAGSVAYAAPAPFTYSYEGDLAPEDGGSSPQWQKYFDGVGSVAGGHLTVTTPITPGATNDHYLEYRLDGGGAWNPTGLGTTIEVSFKTNYNNDSGWAGSFLLGTGQRLWPVRVGTNFISIGGDDFHLPSSLGIDSSTFHTYRFTTENDNGDLKLYVDGSAAAVHTFSLGGASPTVRLAFGDLGGPEDGQIEWDYLRWTNEGAFAPVVPEPGTLSLAMIGLAGLVRRRQSAK